MFKAIDVWKRLSEGELARYRCFQILPENRYCVQSVDFYRQPLDEVRMRALDSQFVELLLGDAPNAANETYGTLEEAIAKHDLDFRDFEEDLANDAGR